MKHDYAKLDAAILSELTATTPNGFAQLCGNLSAANREANVLSGPDAFHGTPSWRLIDRRLQALRKAGRIRYQRKPEGWVLVNTEAA